MPIAPCEYHISLLKSACLFRFHASQHYPQSYNTMKPKKPLNQHKEKMVKNLFQRAMKHSAGKSCPTGSHSVNAVKHIPCSENKKTGDVFHPLLLADEGNSSLGSPESLLNNILWAGM